MSNFMKILPVTAELFHVDGRTDINIIVPFRNFANAPKKWCKKEKEELSKKEKSWSNTEEIIKETARSVRGPHWLQI